MSFEDLKTKLKNLRPSAEKILTDTIKGYTFGCIFGIFSVSKPSLYSSMHSNGKKFAKISCTYTSADILLQKVRNKDDSINKFISGTLAGYAGAEKNRIMSAGIFGVYSGSSFYLSQEQKWETCFTIKYLTREK